MNMFQIKVVAIICMIVDHFGLFFFPHVVLLQIIGRISFPLIAWLIANGAHHTHDIDRYLLRLFGFALISQIPYEIGFYVSGSHSLFLNVLFTLFFGLLAIRLMRMSASRSTKVLAVVACAGAAMLLNTDYGAAGVLSIVAFYLYFNNFRYMAASQTIILFLLPVAAYFLGAYTGHHFGRFYIWYPFEGFGLLALPFIYLYNNIRGARIQYFFYLFFPLQSFAILALQWYR